ncbi:hypothetical protein CEE37_08045 [candidate division LCP-89 bacterium B3_LCP]|uniref:Flagellar hook-associated protein 2 n=1 Tax=candidate division LCP-89 bacterium B3_LCP TaxID=2012998 RepID=A0A532UZC0_UNCL8|nr:MAG: hypothetical protein CEE37_08045 [candidate division LCP-89 bacterium B3_LCP]
MPTAQITGLSSGIDWQETVALMMQIESLPMVQLEQKKDTYQEKLDAWNAINTKLLALKSAMEDMDELDEILSKAASSTDTDIATATADSAAAAGSYSLEINSLAQSDIVIHEGFDDENTTAVHNGPGEATFTYTYAGDTYDVTVSAGSTLAELAQAINNDVNNEEVTATILNDGSSTSTAYHLVLTGATGEDNTIVVEASSNLDNFTNNYDNSQNASDAQFKVNGYPILPGEWLQSSSNEVTDVISGVTLNLKSTNAGSTINITITEDLDAAKEKIDDFVTAYNEVIALVNLYTKYEADEESTSSSSTSTITQPEGTAGPLFGDASVIGIKSDLQAIIASVIPGLADSNVYQSVAEVGVEFGSSGLLQVDDSKLTDALEADFEAVGNLFGFTSSSTSNNLTYFLSEEETAGGTYTVVANYDASGELTSATINGNEATIDGSYIIGADGQPEEGLRIKFTDPGGGAGQTTADINIGTGTSVQIANRTSFLTDPVDGTIHNATEGIQDAMENLDKQIARWEDRLLIKQGQLEADFLQMELLMGQLQTQGNFVSAMISGL